MANHAAGDGGIPPRNVAKDGLTRVMTLGGHYGLRNHTVKGLRDHKGKRFFVKRYLSRLTKRRQLKRLGLIR